jgi:hypothetical protein
MADPHANHTLGLQHNAAVSNEEHNAPVQQTQTHLSGDLTDGGTVHATPQMERIPTHPPHDREAEEDAASRASVANAPKKRTLDQSTTRPGDNRRERGLPFSWCDWCLACHHFQDEEGSYHIRRPKENQAMHDAVAPGDMPQVDPGQISRLLKPLEPPLPTRHPSLWKRRWTQWK